MIGARATWPVEGGVTVPSGDVVTSASRGPLRRRLVSVLAALLVTATVCVVDRRESSPAAPAPPGPASVAQLFTPPSPVPGPRPAGVPGTPPVSPAPAGPPLTTAPGCGLTLNATRSVPAPVGRCTVLEIGDSLGSDLGWGIAREVAPTSGLDLVQLDKASSGLAHPSFYDWPTQLAVALPRYRPQLVVICLGGNEEQGMQVGGSAVQFGTTAWTAAYVARVHQLASEATAAGAFVLWVGMPVMRQPAYDQGMVKLNEDFQAGIADLPTAQFLATRTVLADRSGGFQSTAVVDGSKAGLREADGIHFSYVGENVIATYVLQRIAALYDVRLAPTQPAVITR